MYKGHFVYLKMPRTRRNTNNLTIPEKVIRWNNRNARKMCVPCMLKKNLSRELFIKRLEYFIAMKDNTHEVVMGEMARN